MLSQVYYWVFTALVAAFSSADPGGGHAEPRKQVPVLCYHQVRDWRADDSKTARPYIIPPSRFLLHMKMLRDSGYHAVSPDQLVDYLVKGIPLPPRPIVITFDDGTLAQYTSALPVLERYGFKAVFFIMTVTIDKPGYLSRAQIKALSDRGHVIGCHTWDHHNVTNYTGKDWDMQLSKPTGLLSQITGKPVNYFAYPFGSWNEAAITELRSHNYKAAFQLSGKRDDQASLFTVRRIIADGRWDGAQLHSAIKRSFN